MAKPKEDPAAEGLRALMERHEQAKRDNPVVDERWWVVDYWPSISTSDEYSDFWTEPREVFAGGYFKTLAEAEKFVESHAPEKGATLMVRHENKRRITKEEWVKW